MNKITLITFSFFMLTVASCNHKQPYVSETDIENILLSEFVWQGATYKMVKSIDYAMLSSQKGFIAHKHYILKHDDNIINYGITIFDSPKNAHAAMQWRIANVAAIITQQETEDDRIDKLWISGNGLFMLKDSLIIEATIAETGLLFDLLNNTLDNIEKYKKMRKF